MHDRKALRTGLLLLTILAAGSLPAPWCHAGTVGNLSRGQTVYVPAYSLIHVGEKGHSFELATTLCIRNTSRVDIITVVSVDYYDADGKLLKHYLDNPVQLKPLASAAFYIKPSDVSGGLAPCFIVRWKSSTATTEPIVEAVMIGTKSGQGISFVSTGKVIKEGSE